MTGMMHLNTNRPDEATLIQKADHFFEIDQFETALTYYQQAYDLKSTFKLNIALVKTLQALEKDAEALMIARQYEDVYLNSGDNWAQFYLTLCLANQEFIQAEKFSDYLSAENVRIHFKQSIQQRSHLFLKAHPTEVGKQIKRCFELVNGTDQANAETIAALKRLPVPAYLEALKFVLSNPLIHPLYPSELLSFIAPLKIERTLPQIWFGASKTVALAHLPLTHQTSKFEVAAEALTKLLADDPILQTTALQTLNLQFILLYPFSDDLIADPVSWAVDLAEFHQFIEAKQEIKTLSWQKRLSEAIDHLIN